MDPQTSDPSQYAELTPDLGSTGEQFQIKLGMYNWSWLDWATAVQRSNWTPWLGTAAAMIAGQYDYTTVMAEDQ